MLLVRNPSSRPLLPRRRPRAIACAADFRGTTRLLCQNLPLGVTLGGQPAICATPCLQSCPPWRDNSGFVPEFGCERPSRGTTRHPRPHIGLALMYTQSARPARLHCRSSSSSLTRVLARDTRLQSAFARSRGALDRRVPRSRTQRRPPGGATSRCTCSTLSARMH